MEKTQKFEMNPLEYERLHTLPDGYTEGVADGPRYTAIGNGWHVDTIVYLLMGDGRWFLCESA